MDHSLLGSLGNYHVYRVLIAKLLPCFCKCCLGFRVGVMDEGLGLRV